MGFAGVKVSFVMWVRDMLRVMFTAWISICVGVRVNYVNYVIMGARGVMGFVRVRVSFMVENRDSLGVRGKITGRGIVKGLS